MLDFFLEYIIFSYSLTTTTKSIDYRNINKELKIDSFSVGMLFNYDPDVLNTFIKILILAFILYLIAPLKDFL